MLLKLLKIDLKHYLKYFVLILFFTSNIQAQDCKSEYLIESTKSAYIIVDGKFIGNNSATIKLSKGEHVINIRRNLRAWNGNTIQDTIKVRQCNEPRRIRYNLAGLVYISSFPQDAKIYNFDQLIGFTPSQIPDNLIGISLKKMNYAPKLINLVQSDINVKLIPEKYFKKKTPFTDTPWFKVLLSTAVGFGSAAAYFKLKADKRFDKYKSTNDPKYLDQTDKFDLFSGLALGALQINIGILVYYFLFD